MNRRRWFSKIAGFFGAAVATVSAQKKLPPPELVSPSIVSPPKWTGDAMGHDLTVNQYLSRNWSDISSLTIYDADNIPGPVRIDAMKFYAGNQWSEKVSSRRLRQKRPTVTINLLPSIVQRAERNSEAAGEHCTAEQLSNLRVMVSLHNATSSQMYNYEYSAYIEARAMKPTIIGHESQVEQIQKMLEQGHISYSRAEVQDSRN